MSSIIKVGVVVLVFGIAGAGLAGQVSRMLSNGIGDGSPRAVQAAQVSIRLCG